MVRPVEHRQLAQWMVKAKAFSQRRACRVAGLARRSFDHPLERPSDQTVEQAIEEITCQHPGWGFWKIHHRLRRLGQIFNYKRTWRVYRQMGLNLPRRKRLPKRLRQPLVQPTTANQVWALDFMSDALRDGRRFRALNVLDDYNRQALGVEVDYSLPAGRVIQLLQRLVDAYGKPAKLRCDNGGTAHAAGVY